MLDAKRGAVLITGASTGIGQAIALLLDKSGFQVFAGVRKQSDVDSLKLASSSRLTPVMLDVADHTSIRNAARVVEKSTGTKGLAGLINNAGISIACPVEFFPMDEAVRQLNINLLGQVAVIQAFLPFIRKGNGRIINIGSIGGIQSVPSLGLYDASKAGLHALTDALRLELSAWGIPVILVIPGNIATPIWKKSGDAAKKLLESLPKPAQELYGPMMDDIGHTVEKMPGKGLSPEAVAKIVVEALTVKRPKTRYIVGADAILQVILSKFLCSKIRDALVLRSLRIK